MIVRERPHVSWIRHFDHKEVTGVIVDDTRPRRILVQPDGCTFVFSKQPEEIRLLQPQGASAA